MALTTALISGFVSLVVSSIVAYMAYYLSMQESKRISAENWLRNVRSTTVQLQKDALMLDTGESINEENIKRHSSNNEEIQALSEAVRDLEKYSEESKSSKYYDSEVIDNVKDLTNWYRNPSYEGDQLTTRK